MRLYLDNSVLNRPYDDVNQPRIWFEALALYFVLSLIEFGEARLVRSLMHDVENRKNSEPKRREWVKRCLSTDEKPIGPNEAVVTRADSLQAIGLKLQDSLHLALAERGRVDYFLTCD